MLTALDRFVAGNPHALALVRVPTEAQERLRSESRLRQSLKGDLKMIAQRGRGLALQYGYRLKGPWYGPRLWPALPVPAWLRELLAPLRQAALALDPLVEQQTQKIQAASTGPKPKGLGGLSQQIIDREVGDWTRFGNRGQVSSYTGMCPGENSSGPRHQQGHLTKCGNPRLRWALCETAWRLLRYQPDYHLCKKLAPRMQGASGSRRKQLVVALARGFAVDWWRLQTQQTTPQKLGLLMNP
jgi:transposase